MTRIPSGQELHNLNAQMLRLGSLVDGALAQALEALELGDQDKAGAVVRADMPIDDLHLAIEEHTFRVLRSQHPLAERELRYLMVLVPMALDLERIGDEAEAIALHVLRLLPLRAAEIPLADTYEQEEDQNSLNGITSTSGQPGESLIMLGILDLGREVRSLLQWTMQAFAERNAEAARSLWEQDKVVDQHCSLIRRDVMTMLEGVHAVPALQNDPHLVQRLTYLLWMTYQLERVADHCTNLCERIVFIVEGESDMAASLEE